MRWLAEYRHALLVFSGKGIKGSLGYNYMGETTPVRPSQGTKPTKH